MTIESYRCFVSLAVNYNRTSVAHLFPFRLAYLTKLAEFSFLRKRIRLSLSTEQILHWIVFVGLVSPFAFVQVLVMVRILSDASSVTFTLTLTSSMLILSTPRIEILHQRIEDLLHRMVSFFLHTDRYCTTRLRSL